MKFIHPHLLESICLRFNVTVASLHTTDITSKVDACEAHFNSPLRPSPLGCAYAIQLITLAGLPPYRSIYHHNDNDFRRSTVQHLNPDIAALHTRNSFIKPPQPCQVANVIGKGYKFKQYPTHHCAYNQII